MAVNKCGLAGCSFNNGKKSCRLPKCRQWEYYRQRTGCCETCGTSMAMHPKCAGCGILAGSGHETAYLSGFRGVRLCGYCIRAWKMLDKRLGWKAPLGVFLSPKLIKAAEKKAAGQTSGNLEPENEMNE